LFVKAFGCAMLLSGNIFLNKSPTSLVERWENFKSTVLESSVPRITLSLITIELIEACVLVDEDGDNSGIVLQHALVNYLHRHLLLLSTLK